MKRLLSGIVLVAICGPLQAQISDLPLGDGAEPSITFNRAAVPDDARVVVAYMPWSGGAYSGVAYRISLNGGLTFPVQGQLQSMLGSDSTLASNWTTGAYYALWISKSNTEWFSFKKSTADLNSFEPNARVVQSKADSELLDRPWIVSNGSLVLASYLRGDLLTFQTALKVKRGSVNQDGSVDWSAGPVNLPGPQTPPYSYIFSTPIAQGSTPNRLYILAVRTLQGTIGPENIVRLFKSTDGGQSWSFDETCEDEKKCYDVKLFYRDNAGFYEGRDRKMAAHSISGDPNSSNVYTFYVKTKNFKAPPGNQFGSLDNRFQVLYVKRSTDNGETWEAEKQIYSLPINQWPSRWATIPADPTGNADGFYRMGRVWSCVSPDGTVHVVWYDNREGYADTRLDPQLQLRELDKWTLHRAVSFDNGVTWTVRSNIFSNPSIGGAAIPDSLYQSYWMPPGENLSCDASNDKLYIAAPDSSTYLTTAPDKPQIMYEMIERNDW